VRLKILGIMFFVTACAGANRGVETITGSHIPRWYCRSGTESTQYLLATPIVLILR